MRRPRVWAATLLAAGIVIGTLADRVPSRIVVRSGDDWMLSGDFHVHAAPGDGTLLPWELLREARRAGIDVIAVTNHNTIFSAQLASWWASAENPIVIAGQEVTNPDYHMIAMGITRVIDHWQPASTAIAATHAQGGVAIAAHPDRDYRSGYDETALVRLDGAEAVNSVGEQDVADYADFRRRASQRNPDIAAIGSSDFHGWPSLGRCRTYLLVRERNDAGVLEAIRNGRTVAEDDAGNLYGDPELIARIEANRPAGRTDFNRGWRRFSVACGWLGILGLILLRR